MNSLKIMVMGAGSIGSLFGGFLTEAGNDVTLVARENHINAVTRSGLRIKGISGARVVKITGSTSPSYLNDDFDLILLTVKAYDTRQAITELQEALSGDTILLSLQNGLDLEEIASEIIGRHRVLRGVTSNGAFLKEAGVVLHTGRGETIIGELDGKITERAQLIASTLVKAGFPTRVTNNIKGVVWTKVLVNAGINPFGALTRMRNGELLRYPELKDLMIETVNEGLNVTTKLGVTLEDDPATLMVHTAEMTAQNKNSMLQDLERGKRTEIDYINGVISALGRKNGIPTPLNTLLTYLIKGVEQNRVGRI